MMINLQVPDVSTLLSDMYDALSPDKQKLFEKRIAEMSTLFEHPCCPSTGAILCTYRLDRTLQPTGTF